jgi:hypothetical protein
MDNKILCTAKFTHHDLKFHKAWLTSDKRFESWSGQTDEQTDRPIPIYPPSYVCGGIKRNIMSFFDKMFILPYRVGEDLVSL